jgi:hypothetical protein
MNFGFQLCVPVFDNRLAGKRPVRLPYIAFDRNGQPKYSAARNHPRVIQEPSTTFHWGANSDMQHFLTNSKSYDEVTHLGIDQGDFIKGLNTLGIAGLKQNTGNCIVIDYVTGYQTKGNASTKEWCSMLQDLEDTLLANDKDPAVDNENGNATMKKLVGKHMHQIVKYQDVSKEEASFCLSGGQLRYNSMIVKACSLNQETLKSSVKLLVEATILGPTWPFVSAMKSTVKRLMELFHYSTFTHGVQGMELGGHHQLCPTLSVITREQTGPSMKNMPGQC